jgi:SUMO ligase MMS21 Smc5/6 complex component
MAGFTLVDCKRNAEVWNHISEKYVLEEIKTRWVSWNECYLSIQNLFYPLLSNNITATIEDYVILPLLCVCMCVCVCVCVCV